MNVWLGFSLMFVLGQRVGHLFLIFPPRAHFLNFGSFTILLNKIFDTCSPIHVVVCVSKVRSTLFPVETAESSRFQILKGVGWLGWDTNCANSVHNFGQWQPCYLYAIWPSKVLAEQWGMEQM